MADHLHIVSFDVPYPADYGGIIDVYYKIKALSKEGVAIHLHCFTYGKPPSQHLEDLCHQVTYYPRPLGPKSLISATPFIVKSRMSPELLARLKKDDHPILFEGLHTCGWIDHPDLSDRIKLVRTHNVEHDYYHLLAKSEKNLFRKTYFLTEARKLKSFEPVLQNASRILAIDHSDARYFERTYGNTSLVFPFHPEPDLSLFPREGDYAFYHGNLRVGENREAARFLMEDVFARTDIKLVIAGKGAYRALRRTPSMDLEIVSDPTEKELLELALGAGVHVLPAFQDTGFKLKLLYSLRTGRTIVTNRKMVSGSGLDAWVVMAESAAEFGEAAKRALNGKGSDDHEIEARLKFIGQNYANEILAKRIIGCLR
jgi:hypothetical protein